MGNKNTIIVGKTIIVINWLVLFFSFGHRFGSPGLSAFSESMFFFLTWIIPLIVGFVGVCFSVYMKSRNLDEIDTYTETKNVLGVNAKSFTRKNSIIKNLRIISFINITLAIFLFVFSHYMVFLFF